MDTPGPPFVDVQKVYERRGPLQQYRLLKSISFPCIRCGQVKTSKLVCTYGGNSDQRLCNACYGHLLSIYLIKSGTLPTDQRAAALSELLMSFGSEADANAAFRRARLGAGYYEGLDPSSARSLGTSLHVAESFGDLDLEWAAAIICLCKALELELVIRLIDPLRGVVQASSREGESGLAADKRDPELSGALRYLLQPDRYPPPVLGSIAHFVTTALNSEHRAANSPLIKAFREHLLRMPGYLWLTSGDAAASIAEISRAYRNPAAHVQTMSRDDYTRCREAVVGNRGALTMLLDATGSGRR